MPNSGSTAILGKIVKRIKNGENEPLRALIDEYLMTRMDSSSRYDGHAIDMNERPRPHGRLSPSGVYSCQRQAVLKFTGVKGSRRVDPDQQLLFEDGHWRHHKWQFLFYDMEQVLGRDRFRVISIEKFIVIPELYVAGSLDAEIAIRMPSGKWRRYIVDFKGINDRGFQYISTQQEPKEDNVRQLQLYMKARNIARGILLYDNKNNNLPRTFTVDFSGEFWNQTLGWIQQVLDLIERERMPPKDVACQPGTMLNENCPFRKICWSRTTDSTDLQELAYSPGTWHGIDAAWEAGMEIYNGGDDL